jgi:Helix-turn-helix domain
MKWPPQEEFDLIDLIHNAPVYAVVALFRKLHPHRSPGSIRGKIKRLKYCEGEKSKALRESLANSLPDSADYLTPTSLAAAIGCSAQTIDTWIAKGYLKTRKVSKNKSVIPVEAFRDFCLQRPDLADIVPPDMYEFYVGTPKPVYWTMSALARHLQTRPVTIQKWIYSGKIQPFDKRQHWMFDRESLRQLKANHPDMVEKYPGIDKLLSA